MKIALQASRRLFSAHRQVPNAVLARANASRPGGRVGSAFPLLTPAAFVRVAPRNAHRFGSFVLDLDRGMLLAGDGSERALRPKSFTLLRLLVENAGRLLSQDTILEALWPGTSITQNSVSQCVHDIRRALGQEGEGMLRTMARRGYLFTPQVTSGAARDVLF